MYHVLVAVIIAAMSCLYVVATPIGNLRDISLRALDTLREVDIIACEDTRHTQHLLQAYEIRKQLVSCHGHNELPSAKRIIESLREGKNVAFVSDAGTPGLSDPGGILVQAVVDAGFEVVPIPGPSALATVISVMGLAGKRIAFEGFLSPKSGRRRKQLSELMLASDIAVVYESPFRIVALMGDCLTIDPLAAVVVARELTKIHEEVIRGSPAQILEHLSQKTVIKGEFAIAIQASMDFHATNDKKSLEKKSKYKDNSYKGDSEEQ